MGKLYATIKLTKRFELQNKLVVNFVYFVYLINQEKSQRIFQRYLNHIDKNIKKYIKVTY